MNRAIVCGISVGAGGGVLLSLAGLATPIVSISLGCIFGSIFSLIVTFRFRLHHWRFLWFALSARRSWLWIFSGMGIGLWNFLVVSRAHDDHAAMARTEA